MNCAPGAAGWLVLVMSAASRRHIVVLKLRYRCCLDGTGSWNSNIQEDSLALLKFGGNQVVVPWLREVDPELNDNARASPQLRNLTQSHSSFDDEAMRDRCQDEATLTTDSNRSIVNGGL